MPRREGSSLPRIATGGKPPDSTAEWRAIAQGPDTLDKILAWSPSEKPAPWREDDFYATGCSDWKDFREQWQQYGAVLSGTCVEIGCGVGRMTRALSEDFDRVVALDVSDDFIARARAVCPPHVEFRAVDGPQIPLPDGVADAVFTVHVLQHLDGADRVFAYIREALRVLKPGGSLMAHITIAGQAGSWLERARYQLQLWRSRWFMRRAHPPRTIRMEFYQLKTAYFWLVDAGFEDIEVRIFSVRSNGYPHSFFFGRKVRPAAPDHEPGAETAS